MHTTVEFTIGTLIGAAGLVIGIFGLWHGYRTRRIKLLQCDMEGFTLHQDAKPIHKDVKVFWANRKIPNLTRNSCSITNIGTQTIKASDMPNSLIRFSVPSEHEILFASVRYGRMGNVVYIIPAELSETHLTFQFLEPGDTLEVELLHTAPASSDLLVHACIVGGNFRCRSRPAGTAISSLLFTKSWSRTRRVKNDMRYECQIGVENMTDEEMSARGIYITPPFPVKKEE